MITCFASDKKKLDIVVSFKLVSQKNNTSEQILDSVLSKLVEQLSVYCAVTGEVQLIACRSIKKMDGLSKHLNVYVLLEHIGEEEAEKDYTISYVEMIQFILKELNWNLEEQ
jgi:hypothetical protein